MEDIFRGLTTVHGLREGALSMRRGLNRPKEVVGEGGISATAVVTAARVHQLYSFDHKNFATDFHGPLQNVIVF